MSAKRKRPNMLIVGEKIAYLRKDVGLCTAAFARKLEQPSWLITMLETVHLENSRQLVNCLPDAAVDKLLQTIQDVYGVSYRWLTTRYQSSKHPPQAEQEPAPAPLLLPISISPEDAVTLLDDLLIFALSDPHHEAKRYSSFKQRLNAISALYSLQLGQRQTTPLTRQNSQQFSKLLCQHIQHWEKEFNIPGDLLDMPAIS